MAGSEGKIMLLIGEAFIETDEDEANECTSLTLNTFNCTQDDKAHGLDTCIR
jgi:hypothetical protein